MKARILITDHNGDRYEGVVDLSLISKKDGSGSSGPNPPSRRKSRNSSIDFHLHARAFAKKYAKGLSGPKVFTVLLAYLCKGDPSKPIAVKEIEKLWNKMTTILGNKFNAVYPNRAKEDGWVNSPKQGFYVVEALWQEALYAVGKKT